LKLLGDADRRLIDYELATIVAERASARWLLTGFVVESESELTAGSRLVEAATGILVASQEVTEKAGESIFSIVDRLSGQIRADFVLADLAGTGPDRPVAEVTTSSSEAYRRYLNGVEYVARMYLSEASEEFEKALEHDSTFAMAYYHLARIKDQRLIEKATQYSETASRKEQFYIKALQAETSGDYEGQVSHLRHLLESFPDEKEAYFRLGVHFHNHLHLDTAVYYLTRAIEIDPLYRSAYNVLSYAYSEAGDIVNAIETINEYIALAPNEANPYDSRGDLYANFGYPEPAAKSYLNALAIKPDFMVSVFKLVRMRIYQGRYDEADGLLVDLKSGSSPSIRELAHLHSAYGLLRQGKLNAALTLLDGSILQMKREFHESGDSGDKASFHILKAQILAEKGELIRALAEIGTSIQISDRVRPDDSVTYRYLYAQLLAELGEFEKAERVNSTLQNHWESTGDAPCYPLWAGGSIALARNDQATAIELLEEVTKYTTIESDFAGRFQLARAYLAAKRLGDAIDLLEQLLTVHSFTRMSETINSVKLHYFLGIAYEESRWHDKAKEQYESFLEIWQDADPDLAVVENAMARLTQLNNRP
jgi:Tfp pilus assembly protein PilF